MMDSSLESDDSIGDPSYIEPPMKKEMDVEAELELENFENTSCDSNLTKDFKPGFSGFMPNKTNLDLYERMPLILNGKYFKIVKRIVDTDHQKKAKGILAQCNFCIQTKVIKGSLNITSNFIQHLKKRHNDKYGEYLREKNDAGKSPRTMVTRAAIINETIASDFEEKVMAFAVDNMMPFSVVESPSFMALFEGTGLIMCTEKQLKNILNTKHFDMMAKLKDTLLDVSYLCTTLNVWFFKQKYIFGYTCHWIDAEFSRKSAALGFRRFSVEQGPERIPEFVEYINNKFGITSDKVKSTVTDSDDNVVDAFKEFELQDNYELREDEDQDQEEKTVMLPDLSIFSSKLPKHNKCVIYTLISLASTDFIQLLKLNTNLYQLHYFAFKRCAEIWAKCSAPEKSEMVKTFVPFSLKFPTSTNWYTLYDSIRCLLSNKDKLDNLCFFLEVSKFNFAEIEYLEEYCRLMEPIAEALKFLQTESQMFYGYFLPTLVTIKVKLYKLDFEYNFKYLKELAEQIECMLLERFRNFFEINTDCEDAVVAAVSCPILKMNFVKALSQIAPNVTFEHIQSVFIEHAREFHEEGDSLNPLDLNVTTSTVHEFFDFGHSSKAIVKQEVDPLLHIRREFKRYLADEDNSLSSLDRYPIVKKVFMKYNTPLPSYASVRRLFAYSGVTSAKRRLNMSGRHFEKLVIMKANNVFEPL